MTIPFTSIQTRRVDWKLSPQQMAAVPELISMFNKVLKRDDHRCQCCGFQTKPKEDGYSYQMLHPKDGDVRNHNIDNFITVCRFCYLSLHPGYAGNGNLGTVIWMPEISQIDLNFIVRTIFVAINAESTHEGSARALYSSLDNRGIYIDEQLGEKARNPGFIAQTMIDIAPSTIHQKILDGLRLLPTHFCNDDSITHFAATAYKDYPVTDWAKLIKLAA